MHEIRHDVELLTEQERYFFNEGTFLDMWRCLGAHIREVEGRVGVSFGVWAPNAREVSVVGDFNAWEAGRHPLAPLGSSGVWGGWVEGVGLGSLYKYHIASQQGGHSLQKADPVGFWHEVPPKTASVVSALDYTWGDEDWMVRRASAGLQDAPIAIYELHLGSWRRGQDGEFLTYRAMAEPLAEYVQALGFTHVEFLPVMEHPFYGSWGYQKTGFFAPTSRYGTPQDLMYLIDTLHQAGIGVILDWVPSHFPSDGHGLGFFDGTHLYEHADPRQGFHPDWGSLVFNYGRNEVRSFLLSSAMFWLEQYHVDGLRVDAVASMLYLDYSRKEGEWVPNVHGGRENLEAVGFLKQLNESVRRRFPGVQMIAEESTAWPAVSRSVHDGGLGFHFKWDMGWMHDTLAYMRHDPIHRRYHHHQLTFRMMYAFSENFMLALSHDEVVHGKGSLWQKMPGDLWQKHANLRLLLGYMYGQPGKKFLFMGGEFGQTHEWSHEQELAWGLLEEPSHRGVQHWVRDLNRFYTGQAALHAWDCEPGGFSWVDCEDQTQSTLSFLRDGGEGATVLVVCNFTPVVRHDFCVGVPHEGFWVEALNSDAQEYGGSGQGNFGGKATVGQRAHGYPQCLRITLPPLGVVFWYYEGLVTGGEP